MSVFEIITERVMEKIKGEGLLPWHKPWKSLYEDRLPASLITKKPYRGANFLILHFLSRWDCPYWLTYKQAVNLGGRVREGQKGFPVIFWKITELDELDEEGKKKRIPLLRYHTVFNLMQCEGINPKYVPMEKKCDPLDFKPIDQCEKIVSGYQDGPKIVYEENRAFYRPSTDEINMPKKKSFVSEEEYYSTLFHEMVHSTGHESRLKRLTLTDLCPFGTTNYSKEELVAEMGAAFLCAISGVETKTLDNSISYLNSWLKKLEGDNRLLVLAGAQAQKAVDRILGERNEDENAQI